MPAAAAAGQPAPDVTSIAMGSSPPSPGEPGPPRRGTVLAGRYRLGRPIATGGMARVWEARDEVLDRPVAVKILLEHLADDDSFVARFRAEALAAARLTHPSVVSVYDTVSTDEVEAIVMELVDGDTLRQRLDHEGRLPSVEAARIAARIADALAVAHRDGVVHRDIKPANVLLASTGRVVVTDFGIAKATEGADLTTGRQMLGTAKYLAPEQVEGEAVDGRTDLYALGVVLYEMLCGRVPFRADTEAATALARLHQDPTPPRSLRPDLPDDLEQVLRRTLARRPDDRWPDATSLARTLGAIAAGRPPPPAPAARTGPASLRGPAPPPAAGRAISTASPAPAPSDAGPGAPQDPRSPSPDLHVSHRPPPPPPSPPRPTPAPPHTGGRRRRAGPLVALVAVLAGSALAIALLGWRILGPGGTETITLRAAAFDPFGTEGENDPDAPLAVDGDDDTAWSTEVYDDPDIAGSGLKPGVGLVFDLGRQRRAERLEVTSASKGWAAQVYVLPARPDGLFEEWGEPVARARNIDGGARFDLDDQDGAVVILWITRTDDEGVVKVAEATVEVAS